MQAPLPSLFRDEALAYSNGDRNDGALLRLAPSWIGWAYWLLVAVALATGAFAVRGRVSEYAEGPSVIRVQGRMDLTAKLAGTVAKVFVRPGQRVAEGEPLVQFFGDEENAELERVQKEFDLHLLQLLRDPADSAARESLSALRAERELAATRAAQRLLRAPRAGVASDVRIRPGQHLGVGELVLALVPDDAPLEMIALVPGRYRPMLQVGMPLRFELAGYRYEYRQLEIAGIGDEVVGPAEARRSLGADVADAIPIDEPVVLVRARLPAREFLSSGARFHYFDGLHAQVQVRVRSEPILVALLPPLRALFGGHGGS